MSARNWGLSGLVFIIVALVFAISAMLTLSVGLTLSYRYEEYYTTPAYRYFYIYILILTTLVISSFIYARRYWGNKEKPLKLFWIIGTIIISVPCYMLSAQITVDIPRTLYLDGERYEIPWNFHPGRSDSARVKYMVLNTSYPDFSTPIEHENIQSDSGYSLRISKTKNPDGLCIGNFGGCRSGPNIPESTLPTTEQLKQSISDHLVINPNTRELQSIWVDDSKYKALYFYQNGALDEPRTYGTCVKGSRHMVCDYVFTDGVYYYLVRLRALTQWSVISWDEKKICNYPACFYHFLIDGWIAF